MIRAGDDAWSKDGEGDGKFQIEGLTLDEQIRISVHQVVIGRAELSNADVSPYS